MSIRNYSGVIRSTDRIARDASRANSWLRRAQRRGRCPWWREKRARSNHRRPRRALAGTHRRAPTPRRGTIPTGLAGTMPKAEQIAIKPRVLQWAREAAGVPIEDVARRLNVSEEAVVRWEREGAAVGLTQLRHLSALYRRPMAVLLRSDPPESSDFPPDFRTIGGREPRTSRPVLAALKRARRVQRAMGNLPSEFLMPTAIGVAELTNPAEEVGAKERLRLGVSAAVQLDFPSANAAFNAWRGRLQAQGVIVLVERMPRDDCRGFALWEDGLPPTIVVCNDEGDEAKSFTALHEYGHILLRSSAACLELDSPGSSLGSAERWCNRFAGAVLASREAMTMALAQLHLPDYVTQLPQVTAIARRLRVSRHVVALRLEELGMAPKGLYGALLPHLANDGGKAPVADDAEIRLSSAQRAASELGFLPTLAVLSAVTAGEAGPTDAAELLGIPAGKLAALGTEVERLKSNYAGN